MWPIWTGTERGRGFASETFSVFAREPFVQKSEAAGTKKKNHREPRRREEGRGGSFGRRKKCCRSPMGYWKSIECRRKKFIKFQGRKKPRGSTDPTTYQQFQGNPGRDVLFGAKPGGVLLGKKEVGLKKCDRGMLGINLFVEGTGALGGGARQLKKKRGLKTT